MNDGVIRKGMEGRCLRGGWTDDDLGFSRCLWRRWEKERLEAGSKRGSKIMEVPVCYPTLFRDQWEAPQKFLSCRATE